MPSSTQRPRDYDSPARREERRRRRTHHRVDSNGELLQPSSERNGRPDEQPSSPSKARPKRSHQPGDRQRQRVSRMPESEYSKTTSAALSSAQLAALDQLNEQLAWQEYDRVRRPASRRREEPEERWGIRGGGEEERDEEDAARERKRQRERERRREERRREERRKWREEEERAAVVEEEEARRLALRKSRRHRDREERRGDERSRIVSGQRLERGESTVYYSDKEEYREDVRRRDDDSTGYYMEDEESERRKKRHRYIIVAILALVVLLAIIIPVAVVVSRKKSEPVDAGGVSSGAGQPGNSNLNGMSESDLPKDVQGTYLDPFTWYDTNDFNVTYTPVTVGGLSVMGLNDTWDDSNQANANVPPLNQQFQYGSMKVRGVNLGGWLSIEPFITPSLFSSYSTHDNVVDEWTLSQTLGAANAKSTIEKHYSTFVQESTFADIQAAGFDHVRIPFSYWAVTTYNGDPYVPNVSWRYLLRAIEWARKYGLRINLDLHGVPGSQNGWNHSGHQGLIGWLNGTDGTLNGQRAIDIHKQLSAFFTQPRYQNIITMYGLVNEPRMVALNPDTVIQWTQDAYNAVRGNNYTGIIIFGDGFMGLDKWQGKLQGNKDLLLDVHQYVIFNTQQIVLNHHDKINFACGGWTSQAVRSSNPATGFGPTLCGEWSQADTDCATYLNNVGVGSRWEGTLNMVATPGGSADGSVLTPTCPTANNPRCDCDPANADPSTYASEYKAWLLMFAEAQMYSFEQGWGWFYWTWQTEKATQWSYKAGLAAGIMPKLAYQRDFNCSGDIPQFGSLGLPEYY